MLQNNFNNGIFFSNDGEETGHLVMILDKIQTNFWDGLLCEDFEIKINLTSTNAIAVCG